MFVHFIALGQSDGFENIFHLTNRRWDFAFAYINGHRQLSTLESLHKIPNGWRRCSWSNKREIGILHQPRCRCHITTKGLSTMRTKALDNKAQHFHAANGIAIRLLLSLLLCVCHGQYSIHCDSQFTIQMAALFEQSVYYIYVHCVCWLRLERKYSNRVHSSELIFTCLCVCNRGIFVRLMSSVPWPMHLTITIGPIQLSA